jgi:putative hydrolase of the HAD superfamily
MADARKERESNPERNARRRAGGVDAEGAGVSVILAVLPETQMIDVVGFDADDTLWHSEIHFQAAHAEFERILARYIDVADQTVHAHLLETERRNIKLFGYGAKGMGLSMVETAIDLTGGRIEAREIHAIVQLAKGILTHEVEVLPGVREAVSAVALHHRVVLITKGDLFHQEAKVRRSGLADLFGRIEIVSEKDPATYARVIGECDTEPARFAMVGNSLRSDIAPVLALGGAAVHVPYAVTWALEREHDADLGAPRLRVVDAIAAVPAAIAELAVA